MALAWLSGRPAGFVLAAYFGFSIMYAVAGALFGLVALVSYPLLPSLESTDGAEQTRTASDDGRDEGDVVNAGAQQPLSASNRRSLVQIGRASCRERV